VEAVLAGASTGAFIAAAGTTVAECSDVDKALFVVTQLATTAARGLSFFRESRASRGGSLNSLNDEDYHAIVHVQRKNNRKTA